MPHEVIMPALGMAQQTGKIVAWLKARGDAVSEGEPIMEVETDKATMEVEAQAGGFLVDIRAAEGDDVPVGDVIAVIGASADETAEAAPAGAEPPATDGAPAPAPSPARRPEGHAVIMPALGMAQDSGKIVGWLKQPGDEVAEGEALLEVETDKATMEVEAQTDGWLAVTYAADGDDVPVGEVIATLTAQKPEAPQALSRAEASGGTAPDAAATGAKTGAAAGAALADTDPDPARQDAPSPAAPAAAGRILASPKARRLAAERGIDLAQLVAAGVGQPVHVADLDRAADLAAPRPAPLAAAAPSPSAAGPRLEAEVDAGAFDAFADWAGAPRARILAGFAAGALRAATGAATVTMILEAAGAPAQVLTDPDRVTASDPRPVDPAFVLRDLSATRVTSRRGAGEAIPALTLTRRAGSLIVSLDTPADAIGEETAIALIDALVQRLDDPLRHLL